MPVFNKLDLILNEKVKLERLALYLTCILNDLINCKKTNTTPGAYDNMLDAFKNTQDNFDAIVGDHHLTKSTFEIEGQKEAIQFINKTCDSFWKDEDVAFGLRDHKPLGL